MTFVRGPFRRKPYIRTGASPAVQRVIGCRWYIQMPGFFVCFGKPSTDKASGEPS